MSAELESKEQKKPKLTAAIRYTRPLLGTRSLQLSNQIIH